MTVFDNYFPLGLGTARFQISGPNDEAGIEQSVQVVLKALELGVNYLDTSHIYSGGMAQTVLKRAFSRTKRPYSVPLKVQYGVDKTVDDALRRAESALTNMGIDRASFFVAWSVKSFEEFERIMAKGGIYEAAQKLKDQKMVDHICVSLHAPVPEMIHIIESGAFEGITISYSLLNAAAMQPVLDAAQERNIGVAVMNPLGGGLIPQNRDFFSFANNSTEKNTVKAALRYIGAQPAVQIILSGAASVEEIEENVTAIKNAGNEGAKTRIARVNKGISELKGFCTGCRYCDSCPQGIPIPSIMQSRNTLMFTPAADYNRTDQELLKNITLFRKLYFDYQIDMEKLNLSCIQCRKCEKVCTQALNICDAIVDTHSRAKRYAYTPDSAKERLEALLVGKNYRKVGFYPSGGYAEHILHLYGQFFGEPDFEILQFNSNPVNCEKKSGGQVVYAPEEIPELAPEAILVCSYKYGEEILETLEKYKDSGIQILSLHKGTDIPWVF